MLNSNALTGLTNRRADWLLLSAAGLLFAALLAGGGGAEAPLLNGLLEAGGGLLLCYAVARHFTGRPLPTSALVPFVFLLAILLLTLAQLVPLPPSWWNSLPGREAAAATYALVDGKEAWHPISLDPEATLRFATALLLPAGIFAAAVQAGQNGLIFLAKTIIVGALLSALLGLAQLVLGLPPALFPYGLAGAPVPTGLFANPNHQAQLMVAAIVMCGLLIHFGPQVRRRRDKLPFHPAWLLLPIFMAGAIATQSRAGLVLLVPALLAAILIASHRRGLARIFGLTAIAVPTLGALAILLPGGLNRGLEFQMELSAGGRITNLPDLIFTLEQYWPWGSGFGTFVPVFKVSENLDLMGDAYVNHAHNDLLELLIEGGLPMAALLFAAMVAMAVRIWRLVANRQSSEPVMALGGLAVLLLALLHSLLDYPLRMHSIAAVAAIALAFFVAPRPINPQDGRVHRRDAGSSARRLWVLAPLLLIGAFVGMQSIRLGMAQAAVRAGNGQAAASIRPENGWGQALLAERQFAEGRTAESIVTSRAAIRRTPLAVVAVRTLARAEDKLRGTGAGERAWQAASLLGWRDKQVQVWAAVRALSNGQAEIFAMRADALLRTGDPDELMTQFIRQAVTVPRIRQAFLTRLATDPPWRTRFFQAEVPPRGRALQGVVAVLGDLTAARTPPTRQELRDAIMGLINAGRYREAVALDRRNVRREPDPESLLDDGGFELEESDYLLRATPFDWAIDPRSAAIEDAGGQRGIALFGSSPDPSLRRFVALPSGRYRLQFAISGPADAGQSLTFVATCVASGGVLGSSALLPLSGNDREIREFEFDVPASCGLVKLTIDRVQGGTASALIDDVRVQRL